MQCWFCFSKNEISTFITNGKTVLIMGLVPRKNTTIQMYYMRNIHGNVPVFYSVL